MQVSRPVTACISVLQTPFRTLSSSLWWEFLSPAKESNMTHPRGFVGALTIVFATLTTAQTPEDRQAAALATAWPTGRLNETMVWRRDMIR